LVVNVLLVPWELKRLVMWVLACVLNIVTSDYAFSS
jgi:hypothetical protein